MFYIQSKFYSGGEGRGREKVRISLEIIGFLQFNNLMQ